MVYLSCMNDIVFCSFNVTSSSLSLFLYHLPKHSFIYLWFSVDWIITILLAPLINAFSLNFFFPAFCFYLKFPFLRPLCPLTYKPLFTSFVKVFFFPFPSLLCCSWDFSSDKAKLSPLSSILCAATHLFPGHMQSAGVYILLEYILAFTYF